MLVIVADPCPDNRESIAYFLRFYSLDPITVDSRQKLVEKLDETGLEVVIVITETFGDVRGVVRDIQRHTYAAEIIICTSHDEVEDIQDYEALETTYFIKPNVSLALKNYFKHLESLSHQ